MEHENEALQLLRGGISRKLTKFEFQASHKLLPRLWNDPSSVHVVSNFYKICKHKTCCIACFKKIPDQSNHQIVEALGLINPGSDLSHGGGKGQLYCILHVLAQCGGSSQEFANPQTGHKGEYSMTKEARGLNEMSECGTASG